MDKNRIVVRGGGDIASGIVHKLHRSGFKVLILEREFPLVVRRSVSFAQAIFDGHMILEDVKAVKVNTLKEVEDAWEKGYVPIMVDEEGDIIKKISPNVLVDAIMAKKNLGTFRGMAPITIGVGPGFEAGFDVDLVVETNRGHNLGRLIFKGTAQTNTSIPGSVMGFTKERVIYAPCSGILRSLCNIGDKITKNQVIALIDKEEIKAPIDGVLRGIIMDGGYVWEKLKIADIDPRGEKEYCYTISDKARAVAGGVLEGVLYLNRRKKQWNINC